MKVSNERRISYLQWQEKRLLELPASPNRTIGLRINADFQDLVKELKQHDLSIANLITELKVKRGVVRTVPNQQRLF